MIDGEFPPHGAHLTVVVVAPTHRNEQGSPRAEDSEEYIMSPQSLLLCLRRIALRLSAIDISPQLLVAHSRKVIHALERARRAGSAGKALFYPTWPNCLLLVSIHILP